MNSTLKFRNRFASKLTALALCVAMLLGFSGISVLSGAAENAVGADASHPLVDLYCSQTAKDALGYEKLQELVDLIVGSIEPQAVNLLIERFPCFKDAAAKDELGREIGLYIYYGEGDQDGIEEHENVAPGAYAYVSGYPVYENGKTVFKYMIGIDAETLCDDDDTDGNDNKEPVLDLDGKARIQVDTTFCHELFHTFMYDYNRVGMTGFIDYTPFEHGSDALDIDEEGEELINETLFPFWFMEGLAGCVGNIYPADLVFFKEYHLDPDTQQYLNVCTGDQLCRMYAHWDHLYDSRAQRYDLENASENNDDGHVDGAVYVSGYMACLYLADLECRELKGVGAMTFDQNGEVESISSENLREGLSAILSRLHQGDTLDEVIHDVSGGAFENTEDFTRRFIKGAYNEEKGDYEGETDSLSFCVGFLNYMSRMDALNPETHPAGSMLFDDFVSTQPTPLERDKAAKSDFFRFIGENTMVASTVPDEKKKDGGTTYSGRDSYEEVLNAFRTKEVQ